MRKNVCIICSEEKNGLEVKDDWVMDTLRWIKRRFTKNVRNYRLVVCKECFLNYKKKRERYERNQLLYIILGVLFMVTLGITTRGNLGAIGFGFVIIFFLFLLAQLSYMPEVDMPAVKKKGKAQKG